VAVPAGNIPSDAELLEIGGLRLDGGAVIFRSGSLVEGYGNPRSDVDVYVIGAPAPTGRDVVVKDDHAIDIHFWRGRRIDFEYWDLERVQAIAATLAAVRIGEEFLADRISEVNLLFIHRLKMARPIGSEGELERLRAQFDFRIFVQLLVQQATHRIDGAVEDVLGMWDAGDLTSAVLRARDLCGYAIDISCHHLGCTMTLPKWRWHMLHSVAGNPFVESLWNLYLPNGEALRGDPKKVEVYLEACLGQAEAVVEWVQG
jgi:hypothetical protein